MAQRKHLQDFLRGKIIGLECGHTQPEISEEHGIAQSVISRLWQRFQDDGNQQTYLVSSLQLRVRQFPDRVQTLRHTQVCQMCSSLRLTWSREHALWTPQQRSCVMFSDEFRFSLQSDSRRTLIWRASGTRYH
ncbi:transposable element Tcb1 transposase [Trichonephila clavipes]|nr:transposable element Tcb1 transposase [Trichonephila clavipes]